MTSPDTHKPDTQLLAAFAAQVASLDPEAWERIHARCAQLDLATLDAFLGRAELFGRAMARETDPYQQPFVRPTLAALGTVVGLLLQCRHLFGPTDAAHFDAMAEHQRRAGASGDPHARFEPYFRLSAQAERQRARHAGTAAALEAVAIALLARGAGSDDNLRSLYAPFEPEIPYASLLERSGEQAV